MSKKKPQRPPPASPEPFWEVVGGDAEPSDAEVSTLAALLLSLARRRREGGGRAEAAKDS